MNIIARPEAKGEVAFATPWFQILKKTPPGTTEPYYVLETCDFVAIVATNERGEILLVRQFRHAVNAWTIEPPAGHVDAGETPEQAARKELCEETGHEADTLELLAVLSPSTARNTNRLWVYFAANVRVAAQPEHAREPGVEHFFHKGGVRALLDEPEFFAAGACAAFFAAVARGKLSL